MYTRNGHGLQLNLSDFLDQETGVRRLEDHQASNRTGMVPLQNYSYRRYFELSPMLPFGMMLIVSTIIFILIIFRRWPGLVAGIIAGCLTSVSVYLLFLALRNQKLVYE